MQYTLPANLFAGWNLDTAGNNLPLKAGSDTSVSYWLVFGAPGHHRVLKDCQLTV